MDAEGGMLRRGVAWLPLRPSAALSAASSDTAQKENTGFFQRSIIIEEFDAAPCDSMMCECAETVDVRATSGAAVMTAAAT